MIEFFLGAHRPPWLAIAEVPLFVSQSTLGLIKRKFPRARTRWGLDSGAFHEVTKHGHHRCSPAAYAARAVLYQQEIGQLAFAAIQDWMCEPAALKRTGLTVKKHQQLTVDSYLELCRRAPDVPWMPVVQGWGAHEYNQHLEAYARRGVDLTKLPRVGVGSICQRQATVRIALLLADLQRCGLRLHALGVKAEGLTLAREYITSADSMAWSTHARSEHRSREHWKPKADQRKTGEQNSLDFALAWRRDTILPRLHPDPRERR